MHLEILKIVKYLLKKGKRLIETGYPLFTLQKTKRILLLTTTQALDVANFVINILIVLL